MKKLLTAALALFAVWACEKAQENDGDGKTVIPVPEAISVSPTSISSSVEGGDFIITVSAPTRPKLSGLPDWIGFDDGIFRDYSIKFTLNVSKNTTAEPRTADVTVTSEGVPSVTVTIVQSAPDSDSWESAFSAIRNMGAGWNLGNTLDSNSGRVDNMWIEAYSSRTPADYETAWGQPVTTRELIHMFKEAGFGSIRVPVTWYPHIGKVNVNGTHWDMSTWEGYDVDPAWMSRVKEVVDYVIDEGMYCILNVHHDTGAGSTAWLVAGESEFESVKARYASLWAQIAETFRDYGQRLLFESYNEMLDPLDSWCFASFAAPGSYDAEIAASAYNAINNYARLFAETVRASGGNNRQRNLIVNTYAACSGDGSWNSHLKDPIVQMAIPEEPSHIAVEVHSYWDAEKFDSQKADIDALFSNLDQYLVRRLGVPVIIGEWGGGSGEDSDANVRFASYFSQKAKDAGIAALWWMGLSDGKDRSVPTWTMPKTKDAILKAYIDN
jgi:aryl-phospho-beta-D-glucosidase BglC (GH1 family)